MDTLKITERQALAEIRDMLMVCDPDDDLALIYSRLFPECKHVQLETNQGNLSAIYTNGENDA